MNSAPPGPVGLLNVRKPIGITSRDAVNRVSRPLRKVKVGHAGTLDPLASGVLVLCVGSATRLIDHVQRMPKTYRTTVLLGATSDTLDADGRVVETPDPPRPDLEPVRAALAAQVGTIQQLPPQFSALKVDGRRAYDLARAGETAELAPRPVTVHRIELLAYDWPRLELEIECGSGTYIRSIARDVGETLGCGGLVEVLTRTRIGPFRIEDAVPPDELVDRASILLRLRPPLDALGDMPRLVLTDDELLSVRRGMAFPRPLDDAAEATAEFALLARSGALAGIGEPNREWGLIAPRRVFPEC